MAGASPSSAMWGPVIVVEPDVVTNEPAQMPLATMT
jgi:hypothetical protein